MVLRAISTIETSTTDLASVEYMSVCHAQMDDSRGSRYMGRLVFPKYGHPIPRHG